MEIAYLDCFSGASGDMLLGCLLDAGLELADLETDLAKLDVGGYELAAKRVTRQGLSGTHLRVIMDASERPARTMPAIEAIISRSDLPPGVKARSLAVFLRIARAEAAVHGTTVDRIHFHEIGAVDSLVDIVGFASALERMGIERVYASPLTLGGGTVQTEHGRLPAPAPATLALLAEAGAPTVPGPVQTELVTPTGAALITEFATFERPPMRMERVGYGFGTKEFEWPNALRVWLGSSYENSPTDVGDSVVELSCNVDDSTGEVLGYTMERLLAEGALDVWFAPIQMKKNRPATLVSVLAMPADAEQLAGLLLRETSTLGVRQHAVSRSKAERKMRTVETPWGPVRIKVKILEGKPEAISPEYDDCARLAEEANVPLARIMEAAQAAVRGT
jgi:uncharacterized protein (TIGR00299 family) protein